MVSKTAHAAESTARSKSSEVWMRAVCAVWGHFSKTQWLVVFEKTQILLQFLIKREKFEKGLKLLKA